MADTGTKLSPAEFLAELKGGAPDPEFPDSEEALDDLDFSDLDAPAEPDNAVQANGDEGAESKNGSHEKSDKESKPDAVKKHSHLSELFDRVGSLLGGSRTTEEDSFKPRAPETLEDTWLSFEEVERLILKYLLSKGSSAGRVICAQIKLPFQIVDPILKQLKQSQLVVFKGTAEMGDYDFAITEAGRDRARRYADECSYFGAAPVPSS